MNDPIKDVVQFLIKNAKELPSNKIEAMARVIEALKGHKPPIEDAPNEVRTQESMNDITDESPIPFEDIMGLQVDNGKEQKIKLEPSGPGA